MPTSQNQDAVRADDHALPLVVAVTGHRDVPEHECDGVTKQAEKFLSDLMRDFAERRIVVMSPLAEGADRMVARVALELGLDLIVPLPMEQSEYR